MLPEELAYALLAAAGAVYAISGGADFGTGIWELSSGTEASKEERALNNRAMGPVWEANHVWLIYVVVLLFTCFPAAFAALSQALWLPLLVAGLGIVLRGSSFVLRVYSPDAKAEQRWGVVFAVSSALAPLGLGAAVGAVASGTLPVDARGNFHGDFLLGWLTPLSLYGAFFALGSSAYLAAVYLTRDAARESEPELVELWRRRALGSGILMGSLAAAGIAMMYSAAPLLFSAFVEQALVSLVFSALGGVFSYVALYVRRFTVAAVLAALAVASVIIGLALANYPWLVLHGILVSDASAEPTVLRIALWAMGGGFLLLIPCLCYLLYVFKLAKQP